MKPKATLLVVAAVLSVAAAVHAQQPPARILYNFADTPDGAFPFAGLTMDASGNFYGTTTGGGLFGQGAVFRLDRSGNETILYSFTGSGGDGIAPMAPLIMDASGNLYGTTDRGGSSNFGTVFKLDPSGNETVLHSFTATNGDGAFPQAGLVMDSAGTLYGTTTSGGSSAGITGYGIVFALDSSGHESILHVFTGSPDAGSPGAGTLMMDPAGNLYGTTQGGGAFSGGTVYEIVNSAGTYTETILYSFAGSAGDGFSPYGAVIMDAAGTLFGTTTVGGSANDGTVFRLDSAGHETVLHSFTGAGVDGTFPQAGLVMDAAGNLYGITLQGGSAGAGTIFRVDTSSNETVLHSFTNSPGDGANPNLAVLLIDGSGNLYGTTQNGGVGAGTIFEQTTADFSVSASPSLQTVKRGKSTTYTLTITPVSGFTGTVSLSCSGAPTATDCVVSPGSVSLDGTSTATATVTVNTSPGKKGTPKGSFILTLTGTSGSLSHSATVTLNVD